MTTVIAGSARVLDVPTIPIPEEWAAVIDRWPRTSAPDDVVAGIRQAVAAGQAFSGTFAAELREVAAGAAGSVVVTYPDPAWTTPVVSLVGIQLGAAAFRAHPALGGPVSTVPTGGIDRYEQAWHTDSTPWAVPNRWTVLGLRHEDPALEHRSTAILPWHLVAAAWEGDRELEQALTERLIPWRTRYAELPTLHAPIRGAIPRWFRPALTKLIDGGVPACVAVDLALQQSATWFEAEVAPGRVLVFDNHAVLHRGPARREPSSRTLLRLKVDGVPDR